jgi:O-acetylhomoserine/O-acetylserine sulfhydrylase-like pyridoxal-dependent enzyme
MRIPFANAKIVKNSLPYCTVPVCIQMRHGVTVVVSSETKFVHGQANFSFVIRKYKIQNIVTSTFYKLDVGPNM